MTILHITNGSCAQHVMQQAGIEGEIITWDDVLHEGPVPSGLELFELSKVRAKFIAEQGWAPIDDVQNRFQLRDKALLSFREYDALMLWFEHDLYDQLQLIQILSWLATQDIQDANIQLICEDCYLGVITPNEMLALREKARPVTYEQITIATTAWQSLMLPTPNEWLLLLKQDTKCLPFLEGAVLRLLQEYPHCNTGLSLTQFYALKSLQDFPKSPNEIFSTYQQNEERRFMGDSTFWGYLAQMIYCDSPLIKLVDEKQRLTLSHSSSQQLLITDEGTKVLSGEKCYSGLSSIDRWIGGVHLTADNIWCWNEADQVMRNIT